MGEIEEINIQKNRKIERQTDKIAREWRTGKRLYGEEMIQIKDYVRRRHIQEGNIRGKETTREKNHTEE